MKKDKGSFTELSDAIINLPYGVKTIDAHFTSGWVQYKLKRYAETAHRRVHQPPLDCLTLIDREILAWLEPHALGPLLRYCASLNL